MKKNKFPLFAAALIFFIGIGLSFLTGCEGPAGEDASETCSQCHNNTDVLSAKIAQASNSAHMSGETFARADADCAPCHTSQGFAEVMMTGEMETSAAISNPAPIGCKTCHKIHQNYDTTDYALITTDPVTLWANQETIDIGDGNLCASCHQPRIADPMPVVGGSNVSITSPYWGPHHGTQSAVIAGTTGYEISGTASYPSGNPHKSAGCNTCHMAEPYGNMAGGHTFSMTYESHGSETELVAGCNVCHSSLEEFDYNDVMTDVESLLTDLETELVNAGIYDAATGRPDVSFGSSLDLTADEAGALYNYLMIHEDRSMGIHNPGYTKALLQNSIEAL